MIFELPSTKEKRSYTKYASCIPIVIRTTFDKRETKLYKVCFRYSHQHSNYLRYKRNEDKLRCSQVFSMIFELPSTKEKRSYTKYASGIRIVIRTTFDKRETKLYKVCFKYSHRHLNYLRQKRNEDKLRCLQVFSFDIRNTFRQKKKRGWKR